MNCIVCQSENCKFIKTFERLNLKQSLFECEDCSSMFIDNIESYKIALEDYYKTEQTTDLPQGLHYRFLHRSQRQVNFIKKKLDLSKTSVFEFGAGFGMTGYVLKSKSHSYLGYDYDSSRKEYAEKILGVNYTNSFEEWSNKFSAAKSHRMLYISQSIEFIPDLEVILKPLTEVRRDEDYVYINFMNIENIEYRELLEKELPGYGVVWYSFSSLEKVLKSFGFVLVNAESVSFEKSLINKLEKYSLLKNIHNRFIGEKLYKVYGIKSGDFNDGRFIDALFKLVK